MSKAFTKEDDEIPERVVRVRPASGLPPGALNYMTAEGARRIREALENLRSDQSAAAQEQSAAWQDALVSATIVPPRDAPPDEVLFGATVSVRRADGVVERYRIVGVDEIQLDTDAISWISPLAKALIGARVGDRGSYGGVPLEIIEIQY